MVFERKRIRRERKVKSREENRQLCQVSTIEMIAMSSCFNMSDSRSKIVLVSHI